MCFFVFLDMSHVWGTYSCNTYFHNAVLQVASSKGLKSLFCASPDVPDCH